MFDELHSKYPLFPTGEGLDAGLPTIRPEVQHYLNVCEDLLKGSDGAHEQFIEAGKALNLMSGTPYTDKELSFIRRMLCRLSKSLGRQTSAMKTPLKPKAYVLELNTR
jgi:hypothetical protein